MRPTIDRDLEAKRKEIERDIQRYLDSGGAIKHIGIGVMTDGAPKKNPKSGKQPKELTRNQAMKFFKMYYNDDYTLQEVADEAGMTRACLQKNWRRYGMTFNNKSSINKK